MIKTLIMIFQKIAKDMNLNPLFILRIYDNIDFLKKPVLFLSFSKKSRTMLP